MQKKRLLIISNTYPSKEKPYAGIFVKNHINELNRRGNYVVTSFVMHRKFTSPLGSIIKYTKAALRFIPLLFQSFDLIHLHFFYPLIWIVFIYKLFRPETPVMVTFHGSDLHSRFKGRFSNLLHRYALRKINFVHCVGKDLADEFFDVFGYNASLIIPMGIDRKIFNTKSKINLARKKFDFIFVGSFLEGKGINLLVTAISILSKKIRYCFIGSGKEEYLIRKCAKTHQITIHNNYSQNDIAPILHQSKFLILPSKYETFGLVVSEALYCGVPCIVSNIGGLRGQVEDLVNGLLIRSLDLKEITLVMQRALSMSGLEYSNMCQNAENSNYSYSLEKVIDQMEGVYDRLIANLQSEQ
ncbi:MAG: glycosyltransferase family 4 protein [Candidatus Electrothrix sp. Rat3]|nr:glycosyltransferase family 4 protein [Candidatus Electrothrix rattekaaiensis]